MWSPWKYLAFSIASLAIGLSPSTQKNQSQIPPKADPEPSPRAQRRSRRRELAVIHEGEDTRNISTAEVRFLDDTRLKPAITTNSQQIHLPKTSAIDTLRNNLNARSKQIEKNEFLALMRRITKEGLPGEIIGQLSDPATSHIRLKPEDQAFVEDALIDAFNTSGKLIKFKILQVAVQSKLIFNQKFFNSVRTNDSKCVEDFLVGEISQSDFLENLEARTLSINEGTIAQIIIKRSDRKDLIKNLFDLQQRTDDRTIATILWQLTNYSHNLSDILSIEQCSALYRMIASDEQTRIDRLLTQVKNSFSLGAAILFFERILRGKESAATQYAVQHYAEYAPGDSSVAVLRKTLLELSKPENIRSTCAALSQHGNDKGREAIVESVIEQSRDPNKVPSILHTLCRSNPFNGYGISTTIIHSLFSRHAGLMADLDDLREGVLASTSLYCNDDICTSLFRQIGANTLLDWFIDEANKTNGDLEENLLSKNILEFLVKINFGSENTMIGVNRDKLAKFMAIIA